MRYVIKKRCFPMSEISDAIQAKCLTFSDRIIKLNETICWSKQVRSMMQDVKSMV